MKRYQDMKIVMIGLGNLAEYMLTCCKHLLNENFTSHILAIKATDRNLHEKVAKFGFDIQVGGIEAALTKMSPDIIFLSPPPKQVPDIAENDLKPYYDHLRSLGSPLPILLNFAPDPKPDYFYQLLGEGIDIVNILPNMMSNVNGIDTSKCGYNFITFDTGHPWKEENINLLKEFLKPVGNFSVIPKEIISSVLASKVMGRPVLDFCFIINERLEQSGIALSVADIASAMRCHFRSLIPNITPDPYHCSEDNIPRQYIPFIKNIIEYWFGGIKMYCRSVGVPDEIINTCGRFKIEMQLLSAQMLTKEELIYNTSLHATKGGVVECSCILFDEYCREPFIKALDDYLKGLLTDDFWSHWRELAAQNNRMIAEHASRLSKE